jgi:hypothetical protein
MKKILFLFAFVAAASFLNAQSLDWGVRAGLSTPDIKANNVNKFTVNNITLAVNEAKYGIHGGVWARFKILTFYVQPEILLNSSSTNYTLDSFRTGTTNVVSSIKNESYLNLDMPILLGFKTSIVRIFAGPVGHLHLSSTSELKDVLTTYQQKFDAMRWGFQAGLGFNLSRLELDLRYEGNFGQYANHINVGGRTWETSSNPSRVIASLAYRF